MTETDDLPDDPDAEVDLAARELGPPDAVYRAGGRWTRVKAIVGVLLLVYGAVANYFWWTVGPAQFDHWQMHFLFWPPIVGGALLWFLYRNRGLRILVFPTGLLRLRREEVESFPWEAVTHLRLRTDSGEPQYRWGPDGALVACWFPASVPKIQLWDAWFEIERADGTKTKFTPGVANYPDLAERVQAGTFTALWPKALADLARGVPVVFGDLLASSEGLRHGDKLLKWDEVKEVALAHKILSVKRRNTWRTWLVKEVSQVPNLHVFFGLLQMLGAKTVEVAEKTD